MAVVADQFTENPIEIFRGKLSFNALLMLMNLGGGPFDGID